MELNTGQIIGMLMGGAGVGMISSVLYQQAKPLLEQKQVEAMMEREQEKEREKVTGEKEMEPTEGHSTSEKEMKELKDKAVKGMNQLEKHEKEIEEKKTGQFEKEVRKKGYPKKKRSKNTSKKGRPLSEIM